MTLFGTDLSDFDRDRGLTLDEVAALDDDGMTFVTHKATEGTKTTHSGLGPTMSKLRLDGGVKYLGAYHVIRTPGSGGHGSVAAQIDFMLRYVNAVVPWWRDFEGWFWQIDLEHWEYDSVAPEHGVQACQILRQQAGRRIFLYAPRWAYGDTIGGSEPLWASSYVNGTGPYRRLYPGDQSAGWTSYSGRVPTILQFSSKATIAGQSTMDVNAYRGSLADWHKLITGKELGMALKDEIVGNTSTPGMGDRNAAVLLSDIWNVVMRGKSSGGGLWSDSPFAQLLGKPAAALSDEQVDRLAAAIVAHADNPLGPADQPAIVTAVKQALREGAGPA